jgi:hypothetical protein
MPVSRAVAWETEAPHGRNVWEILCRTALQGVDLAARMLGVEQSEGRGDGAELFVSYGITPSLAANAPRFELERNVDWAKLSEFERGRVARALQEPVQQ